MASAKAVVDSFHFEKGQVSYVQSRRRWRWSKHGRVTAGACTIALSSTEQTAGRLMQTMCFEVMQSCHSKRETPSWIHDLIGLACSCIPPGYRQVVQRKRSLYM